MLCQVDSLALGNIDAAAILKLADVGGGTGHVASDIAVVGGVPSSGITVVEPSPAMAAKASERGLSTVVADAIEWASGGEETSDLFDRILFKEVDNVTFVATCQSLVAMKLTAFSSNSLRIGDSPRSHVRGSQHVDLPSSPPSEARWASPHHHSATRGTVNSIAFCGAQRIIYSSSLNHKSRPPQQGTDYPFFDGARTVWADSVPPDSALLNDLKAAGFDNIQTEV